MRNFAIVAALCAALASPAFGTLTTTGTTVSYTANGATTAFSFPFRFFANSDLVVTVTDTSGAVFTKALGTDYSVTGANVSTGGTVTFNTAPTNAYVVKLTRLVPLTQTTSLRSVPTAPATESGLDKVMAIAQQLDAKIVNPVSPSTLTNSTAVTASGGNTALQLQEWLKQPCNARTYGADPTGVAESAAAINSAVTTSGCGEIYIPCGSYKISSTILVQDKSGVVLRGCAMQGTTNVSHTKKGTVLVWAGNSTDPMFRFLGCFKCKLRDLEILSNSTMLDTAVRYETDSGFVSSHNSMDDVYIDGASSTTSFMHYAIRFIAGTGGNANNDQSIFKNLAIGGYDTAGIDMTHSQSCDHRFVNLLMGSSFGATTYGIQGIEGNTFSVYGGGGGGHTGADFHVIGSLFAAITVADFHSENSAHFWVTNSGAPYNQITPTTIIGCSATDGALAANGRVIDFFTQGPLNLISFASGSSLTKSKVIHFDATGLPSYNFNVIGGELFTVLANPFDSFQPTVISGFVAVGSGGFSAIKSKTATSLATLTYGATVNTDSGLGNQFTVSATNGTAFTVATPTNPVPGQQGCWTIRNTSGGALGAVTWAAVFKMAAFTSPATGNSRTACFLYNGTNWIQQFQSAADVPN